MPSKLVKRMEISKFFSRDVQSVWEMEREAT